MRTEVANLESAGVNVFADGSKTRATASTAWMLSGTLAA
jgi:hypothetical protein